MQIQQLIAGLSGLLGMMMLILDGRTALSGAAEGVKLCVQTLIPSLFPFFLFSGLLTRAFVGSKAIWLRPMGRMFGIPQGAESLLIASFLGGYPVGAQNVATAFHSGQLSRADAERMLGFCSNAGPSFLFGIVSFMFPDKNTVWILWGIHIASAWLVSLLTSSPCIPAEMGKKQVSITREMSSAVKTMASVCGWVILFRVILAFLNRWFFWLLEPSWQVALAGLLELSNGCCSLQNVENPELRFLICSAILSLGGVCVALQTAAVTSGLSLKYYYPGKLLQCCFSLILSCAYVYKLPFVFLTVPVFIGLFYRKIKIPVAIQGKL